MSALTEDYYKLLDAVRRRIAEGTHVANSNSIPEGDIHVTMLLPMLRDIEDALTVVGDDYEQLVEDFELLARENSELNSRLDHLEEIAFCDADWPAQV